MKAMLSLSCLFLVYKNQLIEVGMCRRRFLANPPPPFHPLICVKSQNSNNSPPFRWTWFMDGQVYKWNLISKILIVHCRAYYEKKDQYINRKYKWLEDHNQRDPDLDGIEISEASLQELKKNRENLVCKPKILRGGDCIKVYSWGQIAKIHLHFKGVTPEKFDNKISSYGLEVITRTCTNIFGRLLVHALIVAHVRPKPPPPNHNERR